MEKPESRILLRDENLLQWMELGSIHTNLRKYIYYINGEYQKKIDSYWNCLKKGQREKMPLLKDTF